MELLLKCQTAYVTESITQHDFKPHRPTTPAQPTSLHHLPSALASEAAHVPVPPTARKDIVREPRVYLPSFNAELTSLSGGRYKMRPYRPSTPAGTTAREWDTRGDKERAQTAGAVDTRRPVSIAFNTTLPRFLTD